jgi:hypothetical protein
VTATAYERAIARYNAEVRRDDAFGSTALILEHLRDVDSALDEAWDYLTAPELERLRTELTAIHDQADGVLERWAL